MHAHPLIHASVHARSASVLAPSTKVAFSPKDVVVRKEPVLYSKCITCCSLSIARRERCRRWFALVRFALWFCCFSCWTEPMPCGCQLLLVSSGGRLIYAYICAAAPARALAFYPVHHYYSWSCRVFAPQLAAHAFSDGVLACACLLCQFGRVCSVPLCSIQWYYHGTVNTLCAV